MSAARDLGARWLSRAWDRAASRTLDRLDRRPRRYPELPPGPDLPRPMQLYWWAFAPLDFFHRMRARYGKVCTLRFPHFDPILQLSDPELVKEVFTGPPLSLHAGKANAGLGLLLGKSSLLLLDGEAHLRERRMIMPPFRGARMSRYGQTMREVSERTIAGWEEGRTFSARGQMQALTLEIILRVVFGVAEEEPRARLGEAITQAIEVGLPLFRTPMLQRDLGPFSPWGRFLALREEVDRRLFALIRETREAQAVRGAARGADRDDVLAVLLEATDEEGRPLSDRALRDELMTLLAAGHETTSVALCWCLLLLARHPEALLRVQEELRAVMGGGFDPEKVEELAYLDAVIKESLRLHPVIASIGRVLAEPMRIGPWTLPKGAMVSPCIYLTHREPEVWPEPERFDPDRFYRKRPSPYLFLPFGGGVRRCVGMAFAMYEMKIVLATILERFTLELPAGYRPRIVRQGISMEPHGGTPMIVRRTR